MPDDTTDRPAHTCKADEGVNHRDCPGCRHQRARFAQLYPQLLDTAGSDDDDEGFIDTAFELADLGLMGMAWYHCAATITQLAGQPVLLDRNGWREILDGDPDTETILTNIDTLLYAAALDERGLLRDISEKIRATGVPSCRATTTAVAVMAYEQLGLISPWQQLAYRTLYFDSPLALASPHETLMAARITGTLLDGDGDGFYSLLQRAGNQNMIGKIAFHWAHACASYLTGEHECLKKDTENGRKPVRYAIIRTDHTGMLDAIIDPNATFEGSTVGDQGYMIAARIIDTICTKGELTEINELLGGNPQRTQAVVVALGTWYAQTLAQAYGDAQRPDTLDDALL